MQRSLTGIFARCAIGRSHLALTRPVQQVSQRKFHRTEQVLSWEEFGHIVTELKPIVEVVGLVGALFFFGRYIASQQDTKEKKEIRKEEVNGKRKEDMKDQRSFRSTNVNAIVSTLQSQFIAPQFKVDLPLIPRSNENDLKRVIASCNLFLLVGPSNTGKSSYFQQLANGRSATVYLSGKEIGTTKQDLLEGIADAFGCGMEATSRKDLTLQGLLGMIKEALQVNSVRKLSPLFILDDIQKFCEDGVVKPDAVDFLTWCQEMTNLSLLNFVMISSERQAIESLQKLSGFSSRLEIVEMLYVNSNTLKNVLQETPTEMQISGPPPSVILATLSETDANYVVDRLGGYMGDITKFLDLRRKGISVEDAINGIVAGSVERLSNVFSQGPLEFDKKAWKGVSRAIFECLTTDSTKSVSLVHVEDRAKKIVKNVQWDDVKFVARELSKLNILRFVDFKTIAFHRPVYAPAFKMLETDDTFKREF